MEKKTWKTTQDIGDMTIKAESKNRCIHCGVKLEDGSAFCNHCGKSQERLTPARKTADIVKILIRCCTMAFLLIFGAGVILSHEVIAGLLLLLAAVMASPAAMKIRFPDNAPHFLWNALIVSGLTLAGIFIGAFG